MSKVGKALSDYQLAVARRLTANERLFVLSTNKLAAEKEVRDAFDGERLALDKLESAVEEDQS